MENNKNEFIDFMLSSNVLKFGDFITKSGRKTPYFINTGYYNNGSSLLNLGHYYAQNICDHINGNIDTIFGPSYKGIPLAITTTLSLLTEHNRNLSYSFNRKEVKDHGEGGTIVGYTPKDGDDIIIVEDVITAGESIKESLNLLYGIAKVNIKGIIISVDRMEKGEGDKTAIQEIESVYNVPIYPIVTIKEVIDYIYYEKEDGREIISKQMKENIEQLLLL